MTLIPTRRDESLPQAYGGCKCSCHRQAGVKHIMPCCSPEGEAPNLNLFEMREDPLPPDVYKAYHRNKTWAAAFAKATTDELKAALLRHDLLIELSKVVDDIRINAVGAGQWSSRIWSDHRCVTVDYGHSRKVVVEVSIHRGAPLYTVGPRIWEEQVDGGDPDFVQSNDRDGAIRSVLDYLLPVELEDQLSTVKLMESSRRIINPRKGPHGPT